VNPKFEGTEFRFAFQIQELSDRIAMTELRARTSQKMRLVLQASEQQQQSVDLIWDRQPPERCRLIGADGEGFLEANAAQTVEIVLEPIDRGDLDRGGAGLEFAQLWLSKDRESDFRPDTAVFTLGEVRNAENRVIFQVQGKEIQDAKSKLRLGPGTCYLHARTIDLAGNARSDHDPLEVDLLPSKSPSPAAPGDR
jgi:hypothetical protein